MDPYERSVDVVGVFDDADQPGLAYSRARRRDVAAQRDEDGHTGRCVRGQCGKVCRQRLRGRAEVEQHPGRRTHGSGVLVELDVAPGSVTPQRDSGRRAGRSTVVELRWFNEGTVVAGRDQRRAKRGIDGAVGELGRPKGRGDRLREERRHRVRPAVGGSQDRDLGVGPEPAARPVDRHDP